MRRERAGPDGTEGLKVGGRVFQTEDVVALRQQLVQPWLQEMAAQGGLEVVDSVEGVEVHGPAF